MCLIRSFRVHPLSRAEGPILDCALQWLRLLKDRKCPLFSTIAMSSPSPGGGRLDEVITIEFPSLSPRLQISTTADVISSSPTADPHSKDGQACPGFSETWDLLDYMDWCWCKYKHRGCCGLNNREIYLEINVFQNEFAFFSSNIIVGEKRLFIP